MNTQPSSAYAAFLLRLSVGMVYLAHGYLKVFIFTMPVTVQNFAKHGIIGWLAYPVATTEIVGAFLLFVGFKTRYVCLALVPVALGAAYVHIHNGWLYTSKGGGWEYAAFLAATTMVLAILGDGAWSLGQKLADRRRVANG